MDSEKKITKGKELYGSDKKIANPGKVDEAKWSKAKKATEKEYGKDKWPVVTSIYEKMGGKFE